ncbi:MAG TPA: hypothetical protein VF646_20520 [Cytophagales bacterium]|jgi:hypothetical protein
MKNVKLFAFTLVALFFGSFIFLACQREEEVTATSQPGAPADLTARMAALHKLGKSPYTPAGHAAFRKAYYSLSFQELEVFNKLTHDREFAKAKANNDLAHQESITAWLAHNTQLNQLSQELFQLPYNQLKPEQAYQLVKKLKAAPAGRASAITKPSTCVQSPAFTLGASNTNTRSAATDKAYTNVMFVHTGDNDCDVQIAYGTIDTAYRYLYALTNEAYEVLNTPPQVVLGQTVGGGFGGTVGRRICTTTGTGGCWGTYVQFGTDRINLGWGSFYTSSQDLADEYLLSKNP